MGLLSSIKILCEYMGKEDVDAELSWSDTKYQKILLSSVKVGNNCLQHISSPSDLPIKPLILKCLLLHVG